jgi:hypothetical protein
VTGVKKFALPFFVVASVIVLVTEVTTHFGQPGPQSLAQTTGVVVSSSPTLPATSTSTPAANPVVLPVTVTSSPTPTSLPSSTPQPVATQQSDVFPIRGAFYYPWFPEAWKQQGFDPFTHYTPLLGYYNSGDFNVVKKHVDEMQYGHISLGIASWWGQGTPTDSRVNTLLAAAANTGFHWALYYEPEGIANPSASQISSDLAYIRDHYASNPAYLKIDGRFVIFVYAETTDNCEMATRWKQANATVNAYLMLKVFPKFASCAAQPDGWHQYAAARSTFNRSISYTISPGFWKQGESAPRLPRDLNQWNADIQSMIKSNAKFQLITTFNEWGEGTAIEPAQQWASTSGYGSFLDALHNDGNASSLGSAVTPAP